MLNTHMFFPCGDDPPQCEQCRDSLKGVTHERRIRAPRRSKYPCQQISAAPLSGAYPLRLSGTWQFATEEHFHVYHNRIPFHPALLVREESLISFDILAKLIEEANPMQRF